MSTSVAFGVARRGKCRGRGRWLGNYCSGDGGVRVSGGESTYVIVVMIVSVGSLFEVVSGPSELFSFIFIHNVSNLISDLFEGMGCVR